jgi:hypothetical protein
MIDHLELLPAIADAKKKIWKSPRIMILGWMQG